MLRNESLKFDKNITFNICEEHIVSEYLEEEYIPQCITEGALNHKLLVEAWRINFGQLIKRIVIEVKAILLHLQQNFTFFTALDRQRMFDGLTIEDEIFHLYYDRMSRGDVFVFEVGGNPLPLNRIGIGWEGYES